MWGNQVSVVAKGVQGSSLVRVFRTATLLEPGAILARGDAAFIGSVADSTALDCQLLLFAA